MPVEGDSQVDPTTAASHPGGLEVVDAVWDRCFPGVVLEREHFRHGCLNPAIVLDATRVAVYTDLSRAAGQPEVPAIRILHQPLRKMTQGPPAVGRRLATISVYWDGGYTDRWLTFSPVVTHCLSDRAEDLERCQRSLDQQDYPKLLAGLRAIPLLDLATRTGQWELATDGVTWLRQPRVPQTRSWPGLLGLPKILRALRDST